MGVRITNPPGAVTGTFYASIGPASFTANAPHLNAVSQQGTYLIIQHNGPLFATIQIPHGATITGAIVYGDVGDLWNLRKVELVDHATETIATAGINTEDTSITTPLVNNNTSSYVFTCLDLDSGDEIHGARVTFTL